MINDEMKTISYIRSDEAAQTEGLAANMDLSKNPQRCKLMGSIRNMIIKECESSSSLSVHHPRTDLSGREACNGKPQNHAHKAMFESSKIGPKKMKSFGSSHFQRSEKVTQIPCHSYALRWSPLAYVDLYIYTYIFLFIYIYTDIHIPSLYANIITIIIPFFGCKPPNLP